MKDVKRQAVDNRSGRDPLLYFLLTTSFSLFRGSLSLSLAQSSSCSGPCSACPRLSTSFLSIYLSLSFSKTNAGLRPLLVIVLVIAAVAAAVAVAASAATAAAATAFAVC